MLIVHYGAPSPDTEYPRIPPILTDPRPNTVTPGPATPEPVAPKPDQMLAALTKRRVRVAVRIDEAGRVHVRVDGPFGLAADVSGEKSITIETEV